MPGFLPGVVNVVPAGPEGGEALCRHPGIDKIHFTGSGTTARKILASSLEHLIPVGLELGGKSANIVFADADVDATIPHVVSAIASLSGQGCVLGTRALVQRPVYDAGHRTRRGCGRVRLTIGDPVEPRDPDRPGDHLDGVCAHPRHHRPSTAPGSWAPGGRGDTRLSGELADGYFIEPTVFADVDNTSRSPSRRSSVPSCRSSPSTTTTKRSISPTPRRMGSPRTSTPTTFDARTPVAAQLEAGNVAVNGSLANPISAPFGGVKQSGFGRLGGVDGIREFSRPKNVWMAM